MKRSLIQHRNVNSWISSNHLETFTSSRIATRSLINQKSTCPQIRKTHPQTTRLFSTNTVVWKKKDKKVGKESQAGETQAKSNGKGKEKAIPQSGQ